MNTPADRDPEVWEEAKNRVAFKSHLVTYFIVNAFLWILWYITSGESTHGIPWPAWATLGWGVGLATHYFSVYHWGMSSVQREYDKIKNQRD